MVANVTDSNFDSMVLNSDKPVLVDFWASWCGPCRGLSPILDEMSAELAGEAEIVKVDVDANPGLAGRFGVRTLPTLLVVKNGQVVAHRVGPAAKGELTRWLLAA